MPMAEPLLYEQAGAYVAVLTLNRPEARNAVNGDLARALDAAVKRTETDPEIWAVVLTGAGEQVSDLKEISAGKGDDLWTADGGFAGLVYAPRSKLWIAAVQGLALAGGCEVALACDLIVAAEIAAFGLPSLPRAVALEMIATGERLDARRAHVFGMVNHLAPAGEVGDRAIALAETACRNAPLAVRESLAIAHQAVDLSEDELRRLGREARARIMASEDYREGPRAFVERRPPRWTGR
jgi:enoyl-CoA hydratase/carnithine racemase